jgi:hypothetical protein
MREQAENIIDEGYDPEETHVRPFFDEEATEVARPVVPLDDREVTQDVGAFVETGTAPHVYERAWRRRTRWTVALVVIALAAGLAAGVFGVRLYQRSRTGETAAPTAAESQPADVSKPADASERAPAEAPQQSAAPSAEPAGASAQLTIATDTAASGAREEGTQGAAGEHKAEAAEGARREERREGASEGEGERDVRGRAGGVGERHEDAERISPDASGVYDTQGPVDEGTAAGRRAAREEERLRRIEQAGRGYARADRRYRPRREQPNM